MRHTIRHTATKIRRRLALIEPLVYAQGRELPAMRYQSLGDDTAIPDVNAANARWDVIAPNQYWGGKMTNFLLATSFSVPPEWARDPHHPFALHLPIGNSDDFLHPEALAYIDGEAYATIDRNHTEIILPERFCTGATHRLVLHGWTGLMGSVDSTPGKQLFMGQPTVVQIDSKLRAFIATARTALDVADHIDEHHPAKDRLYNALDAAFIALDTREPFGAAFYASVKRAHQVLDDGIADAGAPLDVEIIAAGHAHIDTAWLWTLGQTRRKAGRTFTNMIRFMEQYPNFSFSQSQPQLYDYIRQDYPALFEAIKARVADGRWEPMGGMWVEADCNISGGESLVRQFLLGRHFFRQHFGADADSPVLWLPDVFGYAWNLPQLIKSAGLEYFFTIKIGWNQYNKLPYDSFWWQGIDGTKVLTHFSTSPEARNIRSNATYNVELSGMTALGTWLNLKQKADERVMLMSYGWGDGGGGPDRVMLENASELRHFPAAPRLTQGRVIDFFRRLETESGDKLPTWNGELYLEFHRGTYTTQARNKRANRKSEFLLHDAEFLATLASLVDLNYAYPYATFNRAWEIVCLNQFHDIIPGSSIHEVYVESQAQYREMQEAVAAARDSALAVLATYMGGDLLIVNPSGVPSNQPTPCALPDGIHVYDSHGMAQYEQRAEDGSGGAWIAPLTVPAYSVSAFRVGSDDEPYALTPIHVTPSLLDNGVIRLELNAAGDITRLYDHAAMRELLTAGQIANQWQAFGDRPLNWDAWDIDIFYDDQMWTADPAASVRVIEAGGLRGTLEIRRRILNSDYVQRITLYKDSARIDFETWIDWRERHILLKAAFPVDLLAPTARYEIQFGQVERPTHRNTSWDWARFETCAQKWIDLSENGYGVALLNDCKYGHDVRDNVMRITLLRSPSNPDPTADAGEHHFTYSLLPHLNDDYIDESYRLNDPMLAVGGTGGAVRLPELALVSSVALPVVIETIKRAEDGAGFIVRLYEPARRRGIVSLRFGIPVRAAYSVNILEESPVAVDVIQEIPEIEEGADAPPPTTRVEFPIKPFQIVTLRVIPA